MSVSWWMGKQTLFYPHDGIQLSNSREQTADHCKNIGSSQMHMLSERSHIPQGAYSVAPLVGHSGKGETPRTESRSVVAWGLGKARGLLGSLVLHLDYSDCYVVR